MSPDTCPELESLFDAAVAGQGPALEHAAECPACAAVLEEHRQLEKDLYRLVDPLPPPDFVQRVMAEVSAAPVPLRRELGVGLGILCGALVLALAAILSSQGGLAGLGLALTSLLVDARQFVPRLFSALAVLWEAVGSAGLAVCAGLLLTSLVGLRRLAGNPLPSEA